MARFCFAMIFFCDLDFDPSSTSWKKHILNKLLYSSVCSGYMHRNSTFPNYVIIILWILEKLCNQTAASCKFRVSPKEPEMASKGFMQVHTGFSYRKRGRAMREKALEKRVDIYPNILLPVSQSKKKSNQSTCMHANAPCTIRAAPVLVHTSF